jgi:CheY-like chemotaxis protein/CRP-like cAMP-binding protein
MNKILIIEDNDDIRNNTAEILELANYEVITAANGKIGVEMAIAHQPDLIICDIMMPVLDGYGVLHAIHRNEHIMNTPFIFLTAKTERTDFRKGMELGADDYISKPFDGTDLLNAVESRLKKRNFLKQELSKGIDGVQKLIKVISGKDALLPLAENRETNIYKKKQVIYAEGNRPNKLYYVLKGKVKTFRSNDSGKDFVTEIYSVGDFLGFVPLLEGSAYRDTAEALEECELADIPKEDFDALINNDLAVSAAFMRLLAQNISEKEEKLLALAYNSLRKKVADTLMLVHRKSPAAEKNTIDLSRESLAGIAGTAIESFIRTLSDFKNEKIIDIQNGQIIILDEKKLSNMIN